MIRVNFSYQNDMISGFEVSGHAGYADSGYDIICSAISTLSINTVNSIESLTEDEIKVHVDDDNGLLKLEMMTNSDSSQLLLNSFKLGVRSIADSYGSEYVTIMN